VDARCAAIGDTKAIDASIELPTIAPSLIVAEGDLDLARLRKELETRTPKRLAQENQRPIGAAGRVSYTVDRGPFTTMLRDEKLVVRTDLVIHARVCKPAGPFGCVEYGQCSPTAYVEASLSTRLGSKLEVAPTKVDFVVTKRCTMTALAVDVTPILESKGRAAARDLEKKIDGAIPALQPYARKGWKAMQTPLSLGDACLVLAPKSIAQGPTRLVDDHLRLRFGVRAEPRVALPCPAKIDETELPELARDDAMPASFSLDLPVSIDWANARAQSNDALAAADLGLAHIERVDVAPTRDALGIVTSVSGRACGSLGFDATLAWDATKRRVVASSVNARSESKARSGSLVDADAIAKGVRERLALSLPMDDEAMASNLAQAAALGKEASLSLSITEVVHRNEGVLVGRDRIEGRFHLGGLIVVAPMLDAAPK
jgi:hypothetical protein